MIQSSSDGVVLEEISSCPVCGSDDHGRLLQAEDAMHGLPGTWTVRRCRRCGHGFTTPRPDRASIGRFYPEDYSPFTTPVAESRHPTTTTRLQAAVRSLLDPRETLLPPGGPGRVLEIGCGSGRVLADLARRGWEARGLEPSPGAADRASMATGLPVDCGTVESAEYRAESFDLVVALMVLEHLHDPLADLRRIESWLRPGGFVTGSIPNAASWELRVFGSHWFALQVPTHLQHFTPRSLSLLVASAGLEMPRIVHQRNVSNLVVQLGRALERRGWPGARPLLDYPRRGPRSLRLALWPLAASLAAARQGGRISFIARKPGR
jgi:SAM-dependent methyltransferase